MNMQIIARNSPAYITIKRRDAFNQERFFCRDFTLVNDPKATIAGLSTRALCFVSVKSLHVSTYHNLDAKAFEAFWDNRGTLPNELLQSIPAGHSFFQFYFYGTTLVNRFGVEHVLYLRWADNYHEQEAKRKFDWHWGITPKLYNWGHPFPAIQCL
jgi:hypothetical protein